MSWIALALLALSLLALVVFAVAIAATIRHTSERLELLGDDEYPPVTLLKPLKGAEESLEDNLRSFFKQDYPGPREVLFCTTEGDDRALPVARRVAAEFPEIPTRFVLSDPGFGLNPKVANLQGALPRARYDLVLQSDANVRAQPDYLKRIVSELIRSEGHLLSSLVTGIGERSIGAMLHNVQLSAFIAPGCCFALRCFGIPCVIGKSMLFRRSDLEEVGGLALVRDILAEDYVIGRAFQRAGKKVVLSTTTAENLNEEASVEHFIGRHARWLKMRATIHVPGFVIDLLSNADRCRRLCQDAVGLGAQLRANGVQLGDERGEHGAGLLRETLVQREPGPHCGYPEPGLHQAQRVGHRGRPIQLAIRVRDPVQLAVDLGKQHRVVHLLDQETRLQVHAAGVLGRGQRPRRVSKACVDRCRVPEIPGRFHLEAEPESDLAGFVVQLESPVQVAAALM